MEYRIVITIDGDDNGLEYYSNFPEDGDFVAELKIHNLSEFYQAIKEYEGYFYQLYKGDDKERIGWGTFDPDSPIEEIVSAGVECCNNCDECFWLVARNFIYGGGVFWDQYKPVDCYNAEEV